MSGVVIVPSLRSISTVGILSEIFKLILSSPIASTAISIVSPSMKLESVSTVALIAVSTISSPERSIEVLL